MIWSSRAGSAYVSSRSRRFQPQPIAAGLPTPGLDVPPQQLGHLHPRPLQVQPHAVPPREVQQIVHQPDHRPGAEQDLVGHHRHVFRRQQLGAGVQQLGVAVDQRQRRPELVGDGREQLGLQAGQLAERLDGGRLVHQPRMLDRHGRLIREQLQQAQVAVFERAPGPVVGRRRSRRQACPSETTGAASAAVDLGACCSSGMNASRADG